MDVYMPPKDDERRERPAIVFMHGGSFRTGTRKNGSANNFLEFLAVRGYVVFTIQYRKTADYYGMEDITFLGEAVEDARSAVRFIHRYSRLFGVDEDRIALMGASAGAITSLTYAYVSFA